MYEELELRALKLLAKNFEYNQALHIRSPIFFLLKSQFFI